MDKAVLGEAGSDGNHDQVVLLELQGLAVLTFQRSLEG